MHCGLSFTEKMAALLITALLISPQASAAFSDYSTDMGEPDIMTVRSEYCCDNARLEGEANVQITIVGKEKPVKIEVFNASHREVASFATRDKVVYMHLPEGTYTIEVDGKSNQAQLCVEASDNLLQHYSI